MNSFTLTRPDSEPTAVRALSADPGAAYVAGGTNLVDLMKAGVAMPTHLVDLNQLNLRSINELADGGLQLGALARNAPTANHPLVRQYFPLLAQAILAGASAQLRNAASNGGNLLQRTRCYYFYDVALPCNKRVPGSGCAAIGGYNRVCGILGTSASCIATHPSDMCVALAALEATVAVQGPAGERRIPFTEFHRLPGSEPWRDNHLGRDELLTAIELPAAARVFAPHAHYLKLRDRASYAFALVSAAVALELEADGRTIRQARLALGGVAHKPWRCFEAEQLLAGRPATEASFRQAATTALRGAQGYGHNTFKIELAQRALVRALAIAAQPTPAIPAP